jgi:hypothetical protein
MLAGMKTMLAPLVALALAAHAPPVAAFTAVNQLEVNALPEAETFEVIQSRGAGPRQFWCAAADYAKRALRAGAGRRIVLDEPRHGSATRQGRTAVTFRLAPKGARPESRGGVSITVRRVGEAYSVFFAYGFCDEFIEFIP